MRSAIRLGNGYAVVDAAGNTTGLEAFPVTAPRTDGVAQDWMFRLGDGERVRRSTRSEALAAVERVAIRSVDEARDGE